MTIFLKFTDRQRYRLGRTAAALATVSRSLAGGDTGLQNKITIFRAELAKAMNMTQKPGCRISAPLARLEEAWACISGVVKDLDHYNTALGDTGTEAMLFMEISLKLQAEFIAKPSKKDLPAEARKHTQSALRGLGQAQRAAKLDKDDFIANLKFSRIYSGLEKAALALDDCAEILSRTLSK